MLVGLSIKVIRLHFSTIVLGVFLSYNVLCFITCAYTQVFRIVYCLPFRESAKLEWQEICQDFVDAARQICPELLQKVKVHLLLHLVDCMVDFGPCSAFNTERCSLYLYM